MYIATILVFCNLVYSIPFSVWTYHMYDAPYFIPITNDQLRSLIVFIVLNFTLSLLPRLFAILFGKLVTCAYFDQHIPEGAWFFVGNPFPETGIVFGSYPSKVNQNIKKIQYLQSPTIGGLLMYPFHTYLIMNIENDVYTSSDFNERYYMPQYNQNIKWLKDLKFVPKSDKVWGRSYHSKKIIPYYWIHHSHPIFTEYDDHLLLPQVGTEAIFVSSISVILVVFVLIWSWGFIILAFVLEIIIRHRHQKYYCQIAEGGLF